MREGRRPSEKIQELRGRPWVALREASGPCAIIRCSAGKWTSIMLSLGSGQLRVEKEKFR